MIHEKKIRNFFEWFRTVQVAMINDSLSINPAHNPEPYIKKIDRNAKLFEVEMLLTSMVMDNQELRNDLAKKDYIIGVMNKKLMQKQNALDKSIERIIELKS